MADFESIQSSLRSIPEALQSIPSLVLVAAAVILFFLLLILIIAAAFFIGNRKFKAGASSGTSRRSRRDRIVLDEADFPHMARGEAGGDVSGGVREAEKQPPADTRPAGDDDVVYMAQPAEKSGPLNDVRPAPGPDPRVSFEPLPAASPAEDKGAGACGAEQAFESSGEPDPFIIDFRRPVSPETPAHGSSPEPEVKASPAEASRETVSGGSFEEISLNPAPFSPPAAEPAREAPENSDLSPSVSENAADDVLIVAPVVPVSRRSDEAESGVEIWSEVRPEKEPTAPERRHKYAYFDTILQQEKEREKAAGKTADADMPEPAEAGPASSAPAAEAPGKPENGGRDKKPESGIADPDRDD